MKERECRGCIGLSEEHTCTAYSEFLELKESFFLSEKKQCFHCQMKNKRIEELEAEIATLCLVGSGMEEHIAELEELLGNCRDASEAIGERNKELESVLEHTKANAILDNGCWFISTSSATLIEQSLKGDNDE